MSDSLQPHESQHARPPCVREFVMDMYILLYLKLITNKDLLSPSKSPPIQGSLGKNAAAKSLQSCPTLCDPIDGSPPGYPIPGIVQARTLERVAISFSNA